MAWYEFKKSDWTASGSGGRDDPYYAGGGDRTDWDYNYQWIWVESEGHYAEVSTDPETGQPAWKFTLSVRSKNIFDVEINAWNDITSIPGDEWRRTAVYVYFYSDPGRTQLIGRTRVEVSGDYINNTPMGGVTQTDILATATCYAAANVNTVYVTTDLFMGGMTHGNGLHYNAQGYDISYMHEYGEFHVEDIPLTKPPVIGNLRNSNSYKGNASVSADPNSISLAWDWLDGDAITETQYRYRQSGGNWSGWFNTSGLTSHTLYNLTPATLYEFEVSSGNSAGWSWPYLTITVRTRCSPPWVEISLQKSKLEQLIFNWTSTLSLKSTQYKIDNGSWQNIGQFGTSGSFTAKWLNPKTTHTIYFRGVSTDNYDALSSNEASAKGTTLDIARITGPTSNPTFGNSIAFTFSINSSDIRPLKLKIWAEGNERTAQFILDPVSVSNSGNTAKYTFNPTQDQLDQMYKCYTNTNQIPIHYLLTTHGEWKDWNDTQVNKQLVLTGIAKTAHIGISNKPRRAQAFVGVGGKPRRAVCWVGDGNKKARRCI